MRQRLEKQRWHLSHRGDTRALPLADRHYNRQKIGSSQFVPPGRCLVLLTPEANALWVTSWPKGEYVRHAWPGAWLSSAFRNESSILSSELVVQAVAATCARFGKPPKHGMITFIDPRHVRHKRDLGRCYRKAGFVEAGETADGLMTLQLAPGDMPMALAAWPQRETPTPRTRRRRGAPAPDGQMLLTLDGWI